MIARHLPRVKMTAAASFAFMIGVFVTLALGSFPGFQSEPTQSRAQPGEMR